MRKYRIEYTRGEKKVSVIRKAESATEAVRKYCDQYDYIPEVHLVGDTSSGMEWAEVHVSQQEYCSSPTWIFDATATVIE